MTIAHGTTMRHHGGGRSTTTAPHNGLMMLLLLLSLLVMGALPAALCGRGRGNADLQEASRPAGGRQWGPMNPKVSEGHPFRVQPSSGTGAKRYASQPVKPLSPFSNYAWADEPWQSTPAFKASTSLESQGPQTQFLAGPGATCRTSQSKFSLAFDGLNALQTRLAHGGNAAYNVPASPAVCSNDKYVIETVGKVIRVYDPQTGASLTPIIDLTTFYNYPPEITRATGKASTRILYPSCVYDAHTDRWFHFALSNDQGYRNEEAGEVVHTAMELAVSLSNDPTGGWSYYRFEDINNGDFGSADHNCALNLQPNADPKIKPACRFVQTYNIGALTVNEYALFITTNEGAYNTTDYQAAFRSPVIYSLSKADLVSGKPTVMHSWLTSEVLSVEAATGWLTFHNVKAAKLPQPYKTSGNNPAASSQHFLATDPTVSDNCNYNSNEAYNCTGAKAVYLFELTNTANLASSTLSVTTLTLQNEYRIPINVAQDKPGANWPLGQCFNDISCRKGLFGTNNASLTLARPAQVYTGSSDISSVAYDAAGKLWAALTTDVVYNVSGSKQHTSGILWFVVDPKRKEVVKEGLIGVDNSFLFAPSIAMVSSAGQNGGSGGNQAAVKGVIAFTLASNTGYLPTVAYVDINDLYGVGCQVNVAGLGRAPFESITGRFYGAGTPGYDLDQARVGVHEFSYDTADAAIAVYKDEIWFVSEYVGYDCSLAEFLDPTRGDARFSQSRCGFNRATYGNWATRMVKLKVP